MRRIVPGSHRPTALLAVHLVAGLHDLLGRDLGERSDATVVEVLGLVSRVVDAARV